MRLSRKLLAALLALSVLAGRREASEALDRARELFAGAATHQLDYLEDTAERRVVTGTRRSGKTEAFVYELVAVAARGARALYLSLTRELAEETIWDRLIERLERLDYRAGVDFATNRTKYTIRLAGGGLIKLGGCKDKREIDKHRGKAWKLVIVDECQSQQSELLKYLVEDSIGPTLADYEGRLTLGGTPAPVLTGYWCEQAGPKDLRVASCPRYEWFIDRNPFFAGRVARVLARAREENNWDEDSITYRREWRGEWVQDEGYLVYPYNADRNGIDALPERTRKGYPLSGARWQHVISIDVGTTEKAMALEVWAKHPALEDTYLVHAEAHTKMLTQGLLGRVRALRKRFPRARVVIDAGGMGAAHALELANASIPFEPARKTEKASAIRLLRDAILAGRVKLLNVPCLDGVRNEWAALGWDDDHLQHHPDQDDHYSDSALYGYRALHHWNPREDMEKPPRDPRAEDDDDDEVLPEVEKQGTWLQRVATWWTDDVIVVGERCTLAA